MIETEEGDDEIAKGDGPLCDSAKSASIRLPVARRLAGSAAEEADAVVLVVVVVLESIGAFDLDEIVVGGPTIEFGAPRDSPPRGCVEFGCDVRVTGGAVSVVGEALVELPTLGSSCSATPNMLYSVAPLELPGGWPATEEPCEFKLNSSAAAGSCCCWASWNRLPGACCGSATATSEADLWRMLNCLCWRAVCCNDKGGRCGSCW